MLTTGRANTCAGGTCAGGAGTLYLANAQDVTAIAYGIDGKVTGFTLAATKTFFAFDFRDFSAGFTETVTVDATTLSTSVEQTFTGVWTCRNHADRNTIMEMASAGCGFVAVHVESTGVHWAWGDVKIGTKQLAARLRTAEGVTGVALTDANQETVNIGCTTRSKAVELTNGAVVMAALI